MDTERLATGGLPGFGRILGLQLDVKRCGALRLRAVVSSLTRGVVYESRLSLGVHLNDRL